MIKNMIGLEAEFLLRNKGNKELTFPGDHGFTTDEYIILGEFRGNPGSTTSEVISNFMLEYYKVLELADKKDKIVDLAGFAEIDNDFNSKIVRKMGTKQVNDSANIYGTDILKLSDVLVKDGEVTGKKLSCGLHIHFSSQVIETRNVLDSINEYYYTPVTIPISIGEGVNTVLKLFSREKNELYKKDARVDVSASCSRITKPVIKHFVETLDKDILPKFVSEDKMPKLKFRSPGFYELKTWGFEYRSLPFNTEVLNDLFNITNFAFSLLNDL